MEALFRAYFIDGRGIGNQIALLELVVDVGLERAKAEGVLISDAGREQIEDDDTLIRRQRVEGYSELSRAAISAAPETTARAGKSKWTKRFISLGRTPRTSR